MWVLEEKKQGQVIGRAGLEYKEGFEGLELVMLASLYSSYSCGTSVTAISRIFNRSVSAISHGIS